MPFNSITVIGTNLYEYTPQTPLQFREGDVFGVYIPAASLSPLVFYEQRQSGPINMFVNSDNALSIVTTGSLNFNANNFPLVTAEISKQIFVIYTSAYECVSGLIFPHSSKSSCTLNSSIGVSSNTISNGIIRSTTINSMQSVLRTTSISTGKLLKRH